MMALLTTTCGNNLGALASRASSRRSSTFLLFHPAACTLANATILSRNAPTPRHHISPSLINNANANAAVRSRSLSMAMPRRGFPQYSIFGPDSALSVKAILPYFKRAGHDGVAVERRGKLVIEFVPRNTTGTGFAWGDKTSFSLSVEELGLCLSQLPGSGVELSHATYAARGSGIEDGAMYDGEMLDGGVPPASGVTQVAGDPVEKVLTIEPGEGATLKFKVDFMKGGVGGQTPPGMVGMPVSFVFFGAVFACPCLSCTALLLNGTVIPCYPLLHQIWLKYLSLFYLWYVMSRRPHWKSQSKPVNLKYSNQSANRPFHIFWAGILRWTLLQRLQFQKV